jgi:hypothetical protein
MLMNALFKLTLKSSAIGALAFFAIASGCSSSSDDTPGAGGDSNTTGGTNSDAGKSSTAGTKSGTGGDDTGTGGAKNGTGGEAEGGASKGGAPDIEAAGGSPDIPLSMGGESAGGAGTGPAVAKFCNTLTFGGDPTTMILQVGEGAAKVTFTAQSGKCVPADGVACKEIPTGDAVLVQMFDADAPDTALDFSPVTIKAGQDWIFYTDVQDSEPVWDGGTLKADSGVTCEDIKYTDI